MIPAFDKSRIRLVNALPRHLSIRRLCLGVSLLAGAGLGCGERQASALPPLGEVMVYVDTDAPVPELVGRLRIDVFDEQGTWLQSRDMARTNASDWPASFSLYTEDSS